LVDWLTSRAQRPRKKWKSRQNLASARWPHAQPLQEKQPPYSSRFAEPDQLDLPASQIAALPSAQGVGRVYRNRFADFHEGAECDSVIVHETRLAAEFEPFLRFREASCVIQRFQILFSNASRPAPWGGDCRVTSGSRQRPRKVAALPPVARTSPESGIRELRRAVDETGIKAAPRGHRSWVACCGLIVALAVAGCAETVQPMCVVPSEPVTIPGAITVPGNASWIDSGVVLQEGEGVTLLARGTVGFRCPEGLTADELHQVGPGGTYLFDDKVADKVFPLPAAGSGPAPCYALIGRIGDGPPFYLGEQKSWVADRSGPLLLGINDFNLADNGGQFSVQVAKSTMIQPIVFEQPVAPEAAGGAPLGDCSVFVFYMDGLRPDVIREMAAMGHIPNITQLFIKGGAAPLASYTAFPSDTITSNGTMWTGCFSDRHGLKGQVRFSRRTLYSESYLEPLGPSRSSKLLAPQGVDRTLFSVQASAVRTFLGQDAGEAFEQGTVSNASPIYERLRREGKSWATGVLPLMTEVPPTLWMQSMVRHLPYFHAQDAWKYMDDANTHYTRRHLISRNSPVTIVWLPETDSVSHKLSRGQFGMTRRTIQQADEMIGQIVGDLQTRGRLGNTYLILCSDHGHHGGRGGHLMHFDLANEVFFRPREKTEQGEWVGGGLGMSVRQHRVWNKHPGDKSRDFVFIDGDSDGAARIFLPRERFHSGKWQGPHRPGDMLAYEISPQIGPVNLVRSLAGWQSEDSGGTLRHPIDLVMMKISPTQILISTADRGDAVVERARVGAGNRWLYRYTPVTDVGPKSDGSVAWRPTNDPKVDPLGVRPALNGLPIDQFHDDRTWLDVMRFSPYPDSIVTLSRHLHWQENIAVQEAEFAPDLVITARPGWYFGTASSPGTMHGYPLADSMQATLFFAGPNIRRGARIQEAFRLVDLTPTILEMCGVPFNPDEFDGRALRSIYEPTSPELTKRPRPVYWSDVDLQAWEPYSYRPRGADPLAPWTINQPESPLDVSNMAYNAMAIGDINILRVIDDMMFPLSRKGIALSRGVQKAERRAENGNREWAANGTQALNLSGIALSDYSMTSSGNLTRADRAIDWVQERSRSMEMKVQAKVGHDLFPGSRYVNKTVDGAQSTFWDVYRFGQRTVAGAVDELIINNVENFTDRVVNSVRSVPAEITVEPSTAGQARARSLPEAPASEEDDNAPAVIHLRGRPIEERLEPIPEP